MTIAAELSAPPSNPLSFRDLSMIAVIFHQYEVLALAEQDAIDYYNQWFKTYGLWDFVEDLLPPEQIDMSDVDVEIEGGEDTRLTAHNLGTILSLLR